MARHLPYHGCSDFGPPAESPADADFVVAKPLSVCFEFTCEPRLTLCLFRCSVACVEAERRKERAEREKKAALRTKERAAGEAKKDGGTSKKPARAKKKKNKRDKK